MEVQKQIALKFLQRIINNTVPYAALSKVGLFLRIEIKFVFLINYCIYLLCSDEIKFKLFSFWQQNNFLLHMIVPGFEINAALK